MAATTIVPLPLEVLTRTEISTFPSGIKDSNTQVSIQVQEISDEIKNNFLIVSPYEELPHLLDLRTLDIPNQLLARALVALKSLKKDYATANYVETFNWSEVIENVKRLAAVSNYQWKKEKFYIVVFRSRIPPTTVYADLGVLDKAAHAEATKSGGLICRYWFGSPDSEGRNLATCVWRSPEDAKNGSVGEAHRKAAGATRTLYTEWRIERLRLIIEDGATDWEITEWDQ